jgi:hypothetical protein
MAIAEAVGVDAKQAVSLATSLLDEYFASLSSTDGSS